MTLQRRWIPLLLVLLASSLAAAESGTGAAAGSSGREQRYAQALADRALAGDELVRLGPEQASWIALFRAGAGVAPAPGAVVILHDMGRHPDWAAVVGPLRRGLAAAGWATLAPQLPVLEHGAARSAYGATVEAALERTRAAVAHLRARGLGDVVIAGHGLGALIGARCAAQIDTCPVRALALIGALPGTGLDPPVDLATVLAGVPVPVLDLYGSRDHAPVLRGAEQRQARETDRRIVVEGADHEHSGLEESLVRRIRGWLQGLGMVRPSGAGGS